MSRAFVKEDGGDFDPIRPFGLPPVEDPSYDAAATLVLLEAARDGHLDEAERATGYRWADAHLRPHVQALLEKEQAQSRGAPGQALHPDGEALAARMSVRAGRAPRGPMVLVAALAGLTGCIGADYPLPDRVIDAHAHAGPGMAEAFAAANVVGAVLQLPQGSTEAMAAPVPVRRCAGIGAEPDVAAVAAALEAGRVACIKIYLGYVHRFPGDAAYTPIYDLAARHGVPVVFHTGDTSTADAKLKYAHPLALDDLAVDRRDLTIVIAHCGNPWIETAAEIAYKNPNVFIECSALMTGDMDDIAPEAVERYVTDAIRYVWGYVEDPSKLMFGSDWPLVDIESYVRAYAAAIPAEHHQAVFHDNAARVFGFGSE